MNTLIVSTGRCGSTLMSDIMNLHPDVLSLSEFFTSIDPTVFRSPDMDGQEMWEKFCTMAPWTKDLLRLAPVPEVLDKDATEPLGLITIPHMETRVPGLGHNAFQLAVETRPTAPIHEHFAPIFDKMRLLSGRKCWVERSGSSLGYIRDLLKAFPNAKLIHIYRDLHKTALSMSRHPYFRLRAVYKQVGYMPAEEALAYDLPFAEYKKFCVNMLVQGLAAIEEDGRPVHSVSYEALTALPRECLRSIFDFMELPCVDLDKACSIIRPAT